MIEQIINETLNGRTDSSQHQLNLFSLAVSIKAKNILETGVRDGGTTLPLIHAAELTNGKVTSIDINSSHFTNTFKHDRWQFIQTDAIDFLEKNTQKYDLIFIDDWHTTEHVYNELRLIDKLCDINTLILLHDLMHSNKQPNYNKDQYDSGEFEGTGPYGGVKKFISQYPNYEFVTIPINNGLTILRKVL